MLEPNCAVLDKFTQFGRMLPSPRNTSKHNTSTEARELLQFLNDPTLLKDGTINDKVGQTIQNLYATACLKASTLLFAHFFWRIQFLDLKGPERILASNPLPPPTLFAALVPDEAPVYIVEPRKLILKDKLITLSPEALRKTRVKKAKDSSRSRDLKKKKTKNRFKNNCVTPRDLCLGDGSLSKESRVQWWPRERQGHFLRTVQYTIGWDTLLDTLSWHVWHVSKSPNDNTLQLLFSVFVHLFLRL